MPSAAVISHAFVGSSSNSQQQERKMALASGGAAVTEHLRLAKVPPNFIHQKTVKTHHSNKNIGKVPGENKTKQK
jgi:hypothetical protein